MEIEIGSYQKKPVVIQAIRFDGSNGDKIAKWAKRFDVDVRVRSAQKHNAELKIPTLEGLMTGEIGDYIIKGIKGEFYPCKPGIFDLTYESKGTMMLEVGE
jgi:hypothetical protein